MDALGYDDVSEFVNRYGGLYVTLGVQDTELDDNGNPRPITGGRDDDTLVTGVRLHCNVAYDHLTGALAPTS